MSSSTKWLPFTPERFGARLCLFCFPFGGGGASAYRLWSRALEQVEVCPVQLPGREGRFSEPALTRFPEVIDRLAEALAPHLSRPFAFFGHSMGALIAFELARQLRQAGLPLPHRIFVSGHPAPQLPRRRPVISHLPRTEFVQALRDDFDVDPVLLDNEELVGMILPILRADYELVESYVYGEAPLLPCPISAFGGTRDLEATEQELQAWRLNTIGGFRAVSFPGNHWFINTSREDIIREVKRDLAGIQI